jgi:hypothetical protein
VAVHSNIGSSSLALPQLHDRARLERRIYFSFPELFQWVADVLDPITDPTLVTARVSDHVIYWIAYLHFGRINGIGIPCRGPGCATR